MAMKQRIAMSVVAIVLALAACEVAARLLFPAPPDPTREPQIVYRTDPDVRYVLSSNQRGWVDDGFVTTNSLGFRGREIESPKPNGRFRVVALGDSVTFGWGVNDADTFSAQLEQLLRTNRPDLDIEVVNLAVPGYATRQEVVLLERYVARLQPDLVLLGFYSNDLPDTFVENTPGAAAGTTIAAVHATNGQILRMNPAPSSWFERQARRSRAIYTAGHALKQLIRRGEGKEGSSMELDLLAGRDTTDLESAWERISAQLSELKHAAASSGFAAGVVILPPREQVLGLFPESNYQKRIHGLADHLGLFVIDPLPSLMASPGKKQALFIPYDRNHPSPTGHRLIAQAIVTYFNEHEKVVPVAKRLARSERAQ
jgi:lysophospholipase L1-like esterase